MDGVGSVEILVIVVVGMVTLGLPIWALVDAASRPDTAWTATGQSKVLWVALLVVLTILCWVGWIVALAYLLAVRPKLVAAQAGGPY